MRVKLFIHFKFLKVGQRKQQRTLSWAATYYGLEEKLGTQSTGQRHIVFLRICDSVLFTALVRYHCLPQLCIWKCIVWLGTARPGWHWELFQLYCVFKGYSMAMVVLISKRSAQHFFFLAQRASTKEGSH